MIRFLADADLHEGIVAGRLRREPEMDFRSANDADLEGLPAFEYCHEIGDTAEPRWSR